MEFSIILFILLIHWCADFCVQTHEQAMAKSTDLVQLFYHVGTYSIVWIFGAYCLLGDWRSAFFFSFVTFGTHFWTDFVTSRIGKTYWDKKDFHNGFVIVGFDQILHYVQLFLTYIWLHD
jgi:hypothetical protein